jgi:hypothetical protein
MAKHRVRDNDSFAVFTAYIAETGLDASMREICLQHRVTLRDIYLDVRGPTVHAARLEVWWMLMFLRKSSSEIGRLFDRDASSVQHAMKRLTERASELGTSLGVETVREIARSVADGVLKTWSETGRACANRINENRKRAE